MKAYNNIPIWINLKRWNLLQKFRSLIIEYFNNIQFYWLFFVLDYAISFPFYILGRIGFNRDKIEYSFVGKLIKSLLYLIIVCAAF